MSHDRGMRLENGDRLPSITAVGPDGESVDIAELTAGGWAAVLIYRGHW